MKSLREYATLPFGVICVIALGLATLNISPTLSSAQPSDSTAAPTADDRASIAQPAPIAEGDPTAQEAALRQAEEDLLKKLSSSLPPASEAAGSEAGTAIVVADAPRAAAAESTPGAVLTERVQSPTSQQIAPSSPALPAQAAVAPLNVCPPCAVQQAAIKPAPKKRAPAVSGRSTRSASAASTNTMRDEFTFHGRSGSCSDSIDDPYVPTSKQARVVASRAHLRIAPGRSQSSLFVMPKNAIVSVELRDGQWYRVTTSTGIRGWLATQDVIFDVDVPESSTVKVGAYNGSYEPTGIKF